MRRQQRFILVCCASLSMVTLGAAYDGLAGPLRAKALCDGGYSPGACVWSADWDVGCDGGQEYLYCNDDGVWACSPRCGPPEH
jgi:hypothetical protein